MQLHARMGCQSASAAARVPRAAPTAAASLSAAFPPAHAALQATTMACFTFMQYSTAGVHRTRCACCTLTHSARALHHPHCQAVTPLGRPPPSQRIRPDSRPHGSPHLPHPPLCAAWADERQLVRRELMTRLYGVLAYWLAFTVKWGIWVAIQCFACGSPFYFLARFQARGWGWGRGCPCRMHMFHKNAPRAAVPLAGRRHCECPCVQPAACIPAMCPKALQGPTPPPVHAARRHPTPLLQLTASKFFLFMAAIILAAYCACEHRQ